MTSKLTKMFELCILSSDILGNLTKEASPSEVLEVRAPIAEALPRPSYTSTLKRYPPILILMICFHWYLIYTAFVSIKL